MHADGYELFASEFAGACFDGGLYRVHDAMSGAAALTWIREAFPEFADRTSPFGYDWLGRQFAVDAGRTVDTQPAVMMFEPGTGEALEIPASFVGFHEVELVDHADSALAIDFHRQWASQHPASVPLGRDSCVGYRVPLFLGGQDVLENLELTDLDVYWTLVGQMRRQVLGQVDQI